MNPEKMSLGNQYYLADSERFIAGKKNHAERMECNRYPHNDTQTQTSHMLTQLTLGMGQE